MTIAHNETQPKKDQLFPTLGKGQHSRAEQESVDNGKMDQECYLVQGFDIAVQKMFYHHVQIYT